MEKYLYSNIEFLFKYKQPTKKRSKTKPSLSIPVKFHNSPTSSNKLNEELELRILCKNCEDMIQMEKIEIHSQNCLKISEKLISIESDLYQINYKLQKLEKCLSEMSENPRLRPSDKNYIIILLRLCSKISNLNYDEIKRNEDVLNSLGSLLITFKGPLSIKIYIERMQSLARDQNKAISSENEFRFSVLEAEVEEFKSKAISIQKTLQKSNLKLKTEQISKKITEITSELESIKSGNTVVSSLQDEDECSDLENMDNSPQFSSQYFYSLCIHYKMQHPDLANVSIQKLFDRATNLKIPCQK